MPSGASSYSSLVDGAFWFILGASVILLVGVTVVMIGFTVRYSRKRNPRPAQIEGSKRLEVLWTVLPTILVLVMFWYGWTGFKVMRDVPDEGLRVKVTAQMWSWLYTYPDGMQSAELVVPTGENVILELESRDVIHSFFVPAFRLKEDCMPGRTNHAWFSTTRDGVWDVFCAEYCGDRHSAMLSTVRSIPRAEFDQWLADGGGGMMGTQLLTLKGCTACHSLDGSPLVAPTFKGIWGRTEMVRKGDALYEVVVDEDYVRRSIRDPNGEIVDGFQAQMPSMEGLVSDEDIETIIQIFQSPDLAGSGE